MGRRRGGAGGEEEQEERRSRRRGGAGGEEEQEEQEARSVLEARVDSVRRGRLRRRLRGVVGEVEGAHGERLALYCPHHAARVPREPLLFDTLLLRSIPVARVRAAGLRVAGVPRAVSGALGRHDLVRLAERLAHRTAVDRPDVHKRAVPARLLRPVAYGNAGVRGKDFGGRGGLVVEGIAALPPPGRCGRRRGFARAGLSRARFTRAGCDVDNVGCNAVSDELTLAALPREEPEHGGILVSAMQLYVHVWVEDLSLVTLCVAHDAHVPVWSRCVGLIHEKRALASRQILPQGAEAAAAHLSPVSRGRREEKKEHHFVGRHADTCAPGSYFW
jgi:hypothetical protein